MNMQKLLKQAQEMQEKMQRELSETVVEASAGGGMVVVKMSGHKQLVSVKIDPEIVNPDPEEVDILQDLIVAAVNEANRKLEETLKNKMGSLTGGLPEIFG